MRAAVLKSFGLPAQIELTDLPSSHPGPGQVAVQIEHTTVSFPDVMVIEGTYQSLPELPFVPGTEYVGRVAEVGSDDLGLRRGQRVVGRVASGAFQQWLVVEAETLVAVPEDVDPVDAVSIPISALTAHHALHQRARVLKDDIVLVTGATGIVGTAAVQVAAELGCRVLAAVRNPAEVPGWVSKFADEVIAAAPDELPSRVREATGGRGVDVVIETVGEPVFSAALRSMAWDGRLAVVGFAGGQIPAPKAGLLLVKNIGVAGIQITDYWARRTDGARRGVEELLDMTRRGRLVLPPAERFTPDALAEGVQAVRDRTAQRVVVDWA